METTDAIFRNIAKAVSGRAFDFGGDAMVNRNAFKGMEELVKWQSDSYLFADAKNAAARE